jgi:hypothetical protein
MKNSKLKALAAAAVLAFAGSPRPAAAVEDGKVAICFSDPANLQTVAGLSVEDACKIGVAPTTFLDTVPLGDISKSGITLAAAPQVSTAGLKFTPKVSPVKATTTVAAVVTPITTAGSPRATSSTGSTIDPKKYATPTVSLGSKAKTFLAVPIKMATEGLTVLALIVGLLGFARFFSRKTRGLVLRFATHSSKQDIKRNWRPGPGIGKFGLGLGIVELAYLGLNSAVKVKIAGHKIVTPILGVGSGVAHTIFLAILLPLSFLLIAKLSMAEGGLLRFSNKGELGDRSRGDAPVFKAIDNGISSFEKVEGQRIGKPSKRLVAAVVVTAANVFFISTLGTGIIAMLTAAVLIALNVVVAKELLRPRSDTGFFNLLKEVWTSATSKSKRRNLAIGAVAVAVASQVNPWLQTVIIAAVTFMPVRAIIGRLLDEAGETNAALANIYAWLPAVLGGNADTHVALEADGDVRISPVSGTVFTTSIEDLQLKVISVTQGALTFGSKGNFDYTLRRPSRAEKANFAAYVESGGVVVETSMSGTDTKDGELLSLDGDVPNVSFSSESMTLPPPAFSLGETLSLEPANPEIVDVDFKIADADWFENAPVKAERGGS